MAGIAIRHVEKSFGRAQVIHGIDLEVRDGELVVLVGPSGCGKSTLLRMIAGLEGVTGGEIAIGDTVVNDLPPRARDIAMVFQDYALYPHKSVYDNMAFGLRMRGSPKAEIDTRVNEAAEILQIGHLLDRRPGQLSGGQRQRVAMGRAIVRRPKVFLFDEPLSNLDAQLRGEVRVEIKKLHQRFGTTIVYVTHDQVEAMTLADRIAVLRGGRLEQFATPYDIYNRPASRFVASFMGSPPMTVVPAAISADGHHIALQDGTSLPIPEARRPTVQAASGRPVALGLRPEHVRPGEARDAGDVAVDARVEVIEPLGSETLTWLTIGGRSMTGRFPPEQAVQPGQTVRVTLAMSRMHLFDGETGAAIAA
ncbi:ABC transporter ATP-binding protein [Salinarimonas soli]|uniref:sn-glycerol-3-phosphate ABC transporter ATP-binding protein UgpC n=1 Tax=Salinarimonas soli TaxID=1638099 RepID=A0A5B2V8S2_9HYPH|nr:sn-glycerol-3-phosphate ABC transporter ATP-binding protein UgpC [Salinarimonas soli]KAA2235206.1 sn-glycerol-3-phosphate ABC transporter ATP-binding protein UgpC [Salinarimonas soli]